MSLIFYSILKNHQQMLFVELSSSFAAFGLEFSSVRFYSHDCVHIILDCAHKQRQRYNHRLTEKFQTFKVLLTFYKQDYCKSLQFTIFFML